MSGMEDWINKPGNLLMGVVGVSALILILGGLLRQHIHSIIAVEVLFLLYYFVNKDRKPVAEATPEPEPEKEKEAEES
jgi:hypothetical protein